MVFNYSARRVSYFARLTIVCTDLEVSKIPASMRPFMTAFKYNLRIGRVYNRKLAQHLHGRGNRTLLNAEQRRSQRRLLRKPLPWPAIDLSF